MSPNWLNSLQHCLLPPTCILCDNLSFSEKDICQHCLSQLLRNSPCCYQCGNLFKQADNEQTICSKCLKNPPFFDHTIAPFAYQGIIKSLVTRLKFENNYKNARLLGMLLAEYLREKTLPEAIIPVPLHQQRYQQRGFNQAIEIGKTLSTQLQIPLLLNTCIRHRDTPHQLSLPAKERCDNIKNAFGVVKAVPYSHVAVLDDVMTTGSTVAEIANALKTAGVLNVDVWVCARAGFS